MDILAGLGLGLLGLPLMLLIAAAIYADSPGPILFRARRVGRGASHFTMYKFRTMVKDAEERLHEFSHLNLAEGMVKIPDDPRVTRVGRVLRRFSLDELPQIYNILAGHMSLVGPRPHGVDELPAASHKHDPRLAMRPGLTGLWQISARSDPSLARRIHFDTLYVTGWSLGMDAKILVKTVAVVVLGAGGSVQQPQSAVQDHSDAYSIMSNGAGRAKNGAVTPAIAAVELAGSAAQRPAQHRPAATAVPRHIDVAAVAVGEEGS